MPRIILKCPYLKGGKTKTAAHLAHLVKYVATRDGVDKMDDTKKLLPTTQNQQKLIAEILEKFPDEEKMFEYEDYLAKPTIENATEFITQVLEQNLDLVGKKENYVDYIAHRPRVEKMGTHGLFTAEGVPIVLSDVANTVAQHPGNVWLPIISLRREDAARLGYDSGVQWRDLLRGQASEIAKSLKIPAENFRWYAAFHNESHHPHAHMICCSTNPKDGYLTVDGIEKMKSGLARKIFRQELISIYAEQTQSRDLLTSESQTVMRELCKRCALKVSGGICENEKVSELLLALGERLKSTSGKLAYGYLQPDVKQMVDSIVDELAKDENLAKLYDLWYEKRFDVLRTYTDTMPPKEPLSQLSEFKSIKNMVIKEAVQLASGNFSFEDEQMAEPEIVDDAQLPQADPPQDDGAIVEFGDEDSTLPDDATDMPASNGEVYVEWTKEYKRARRSLFGDEDTPPDFAEAFERLSLEAENGNALAMHDLGRMFADGLGRDADADTAYQWYAKALAAFHIVEDAEPKTSGCEATKAPVERSRTHAVASAMEAKADKHYTEYRIGKMYNAGLGTEHKVNCPEGAREGGLGRDYEKAAQWFTPAAAEGRSKNGEGNGFAGREAIEAPVERQRRQASLQNKVRPNGSKLAQYSLGGLYYKGNGVAQNFETALQLYQKSDAQDFSYASYELAKMHRDGIGTEKNEAKAGEHFKKAFTGFVSLEKKSHDDKLQYRIGQMLLTGIGTETDLARATEYFEKSARLGNTNAQYQLAKIYLADEAADPFKIQDAIAWLTKSAEGENQFAQYALAKLYRDGTHVERDEQKAVVLFTLAAEQENEYAAYALGKLHLKSDTLQRDVGAAVKWLTKAADLGNQYAQYALGKLYLLGDDVPKDIAKAIALLEKSAEQKNQFAQYQLGKLYLVGEDVPKDVETALRWLGEAAGQGNQFAQYALGKLYLMGKDVPRDKEKALEYFTLAAVQGNEYAQFFIDHMDSFRDPSLALAATNLLRQLSRIFEDKAIPDLNRKAMQIDRKRRQKLAEKKQAQGHARDDHEQEFIL